MNLLSLTRFSLAGRQELGWCLFPVFRPWLFANTISAPDSSDSIS